MTLDNITYKKTLFFGNLLLLLFLGCKNDKAQLQNDAKSGEVDSVLIWVKKSRNTAISKTEREEWLAKANNTASVSSNDTLKSNYFSRISLAYLKLEDSANFRTTNKKAMELAKKLGDSSAYAETQWDLGFFLRGSTHQDSSYYHYQEAQKIFAQMGDDFYSARMLYNMAAVQADVRDYTGSEITTIRAIELLKPLNKYRQLSNCYDNLGSVTNALKEYDRSVEYYEKSLEYQEKLKEKNELGYGTLNNMGMVYQEQGQHQKAIQAFNEVLDYDSLYYKDTESYSTALSNLAYSKYKSADTIGLLPLFNRALEIKDSINDLRGISLTNFHLAEYYLDKKDTSTALDHARQAKTFAEKSSNNRRLLETLKLFPRLDPKNAAAYSQEYIALNDSLQQEERKTRNKFARIRFETDEFIAENRLLARQRQLLIGIAIGLSLLAGSIFIIISQRVKNEKLKFQQKQQEKNQEVFDLILSQKKKLEEVKQQEQKRISEELHDGVQSQINGIRMVLLGLNKKTDENSLTLRHEAITKLQDVQEEVRTISHELSHASYRKIHNFSNFIDELLKEIGDAAKIAYEFRYDQERDWDQLSGETKINLYRIIQESLQNCVKHAKAKKMILDFKASETDLIISLTDDGVGFNVRKGKRGIGLKNITSRVQKLQGTWDIKSKIGEGTTVIINVPV